MKSLEFHQRVAPWAIGAVLALGPASSWSASLGELNIFSGVADPLRAEIPLQATEAEMADISVRIAAPEVFRTAGLDYRPGLKDLALSVAKQGDQASIIIRSSRPLDEPELRVLIEVSWAAGRQIREYVLASPARAPLPVPKLEAPVASQLPASAEALNEAGGERLVKPGETLHAIAEETRYRGVSVEQMLLGLFNANPAAFAEQSVHRLKSGVILNVPSETFVAAIPEGDAKQFYLSHVADWQGYRRGVAEAARKMDLPKEGNAQAASGKIESRAQPVAVPDDKSARDHLRVDATLADAGQRSKDRASAIADRVAQEKALKDAQERLAVLEKNVQELQRLLQLRNADLAAMQQSAAGDGPGVANEGVAAWAGRQLANPLVVSLVTALLAVLSVLGWSSRRKRPDLPVAATDSRTSPGLGDGNGAGDSPAAAADLSGNAFDMTKISLDLTAKPVDDGSLPWKEAPRA